MGDTGNEVSASNTQDEDDSTFDKQQKKIERLSVLLIKAKESITSYKAKIEDLEKELLQAQVIQSEQQTMIKKLAKFEPPRPDSIKEVICRVKIAEEIHCYVKASQNCLWLPEGTFKVKTALPDIIDSSNTKKAVVDQMNAITMDWQEKNKKIAEKLAAQETRNGYLQEIIKEQANKLETVEREIKGFKEGVYKMIGMSAEVYDEIFTMVLGDVADNGKIGTIGKMISNLAVYGTDKDTVKVKEHLSVLLKSLFDTSKRLLFGRNELKTQDSAWRSTCDALLQEKEDIKQQIAKIKSESIAK
jgi:DNA repair exonuclease SbcCD ATPase subunit